MRGAGAYNAQNGFRSAASRRSGVPGHDHSLYIFEFFFTVADPRERNSIWSSSTVDFERFSFAAVLFRTSGLHDFVPAFSAFVIFGRFRTESFIAVGLHFGRFTNLGQFSATVLQ